ncbi:cytochrome P450 CYP72A219-like [Olea europaea var. sylvestris]|uniref:Cytochrome P450 CYP72A219-like n=1 Tax=Olea europaea subsp. europaea TaxID=158383 RepID=A0A8S0U1C9_OLEEU|nr:cytochrome P450 CYP72A219-like [Olea europaea var. sylvestris]CAA3012081.1 cytochrome P450 CYP72A219-like [Olea europaea subsp. europaea]
MDATFGILFTCILIASVTWTVKFLNWVWLRPKKLEKCLRKQGFNGNSYRFFIGDMKDFITSMKEERPRSVKLCDDISSHILPYYYQIIKKFGKSSFVWFGPSPRLNVTDPELMKEILTKPGLFQKPHPDPIRDTIVGGLLFLENEKWTKHRKIINPAFHLEKLKNMVPEINLSCSNMIDKWEALVSRTEGSFELDVWPSIEDLTGDVISRTAFGCNFEDGRRIFELQKEEVELVLQLLQFSFIPGWRYLPIKANRRVKAISQEIQALLRGIVNKREKAMERGEATADDLLGILMESNFKEIQEHGNKSGGMSIEEVIEECKLFYFAGSETTSNLLVWTIVLLSKHQEWQVRARDEVLQVFGMKTPTFDELNHLKTVTMILQEVLRLYPPAPLIIRAPTKPVKLGNTTLPVGVQLTLLIGLLHYDPKIWGKDVKEFKPQRFSEGIFNATKTQFCFLPFSAGPRVCIGQNFAMIEAKMAVSMILQKFSFELSPSYVHAPFPVMTLQPQLGASIILQKL